MLEQAWVALEDAGYAPTKMATQLKRQSALFAGITKQDFNRLEGESYLSTSYAAMVNRISHQLDLRGPSMAVDTM